MPVKVNGEELHFSILDELEPYLDELGSYTVKDDKLIACSPFREEAHPSFAVNLENGSWIDSGNSTGYGKGHFLELLAYFREETLEDTAHYLLNRYSVYKLAVDELTLDVAFLHPKEKARVFTQEDLQQYAYRHKYLSGRGISEKVQQLFRIGYDKTSKAVAMPWVDTEGHIVNIKFRQVNSKQFWYIKGGQSLKFQLYGLYQARQSHNTELFLVESEIDCLRLWSLGYAAIAFGTAHMSKWQEELLLRYCTKAIIAVDNDAAGEKFKKQLYARLTGKLEILEIQFPTREVKDISDMTDVEIRECASNPICPKLNLK